MFKIALNAGHGLKTAGKRCLKTLDPKQTREWQLNSRICNKIEEKLKSYDGYELIRLDDVTGKTDIPFKTRTDKANKFCADFYLAIHHNAGVKGGKGGGIVSIVYTNAKEKSVEYQKALYDKLIEYTGLKGNRSQPLQKQNFHEVRESKMPAVLLELGFMDSVTDVPIILTEDFADKAATACVEVLVEKGRLAKKVAKPPKVEQPKPTPKPTPKPNSIYYPKYNGVSKSLVDALKSLKINSSLRYRGKIAKANGIVKNELLFVGLASHNSKMLNLLKQGKLIKP